MKSVDTHTGPRDVTLTPQEARRRREYHEARQRERSAQQRARPAELEYRIAEERARQAQLEEQHTCSNPYCTVCS